MKPPRSSKRRATNKKGQVHGHISRKKSKKGKFRGLDTAMLAAGVVMNNTKQRGKSGYKVNGNIDHRKVVGRERFGNIVVNAGGTVGSLIQQIVLHPKSLGVTQLAKEANNYEQYRVNHLRIKFITASTTATDGAMLGYFDRDPADVFPGDYETRLKFADRSKNKAGGVYYKSHTWTLPKKRDWLWVDPGNEIRLTTIGNWYLLQEVANSTGTAQGTLEIEYDFDFKTARDEEDDVYSDYARGSGSGSGTQLFPFGTAANPVNWDIAGGFSDSIVYGRINPGGTSITTFYLPSSANGYLVIFILSNATAASAPVLNTDILVSSNLSVITSTGYVLANASSQYTAILQNTNTNMPTPSGYPSGTYICVQNHDSGVVTTASSKVIIVPINYLVDVFAKNSLAQAQKQLNDLTKQLEAAKQRQICLEEKRSDPSSIYYENTTPKAKERSVVNFNFSEDEQTLRNENVVRMATGSSNGENKISQSSKSALGLLDNDNLEDYEVEELKREADQHGFVLIRRDQGLLAVQEREPERQQRTRVPDDLVGVGEPVLRRKSVIGGEPGRSSSLK